MSMSDLLEIRTFFGYLGTKIGFSLFSVFSMDSCFSPKKLLPVKFLTFAFQCYFSCKTIILVTLNFLVLFLCFVPFLGCCVFHYYCHLWFWFSMDYFQSSFASFHTFLPFFFSVMLSSYLFYIIAWHVVIVFYLLISVFLLWFIACCSCWLLSDTLSWLFPSFPSVLFLSLVHIKLSYVITFLC